MRDTSKNDLFNYIRDEIGDSDRLSYHELLDILEMSVPHGCALNWDSIICWDNAATQRIRAAYFTLAKC